MKDKLQYYSFGFPKNLTIKTCTNHALKHSYLFNLRTYKMRD